MTTTNSIPESIDPIITLGMKALAGAQAVGADVDLGQNTAAKIAVDLYDFIGDSATPLVPGKQARHAAQKLVVKLAYASAAKAKRAGIEFCRLSIGVLKSFLGNRWNSQWNAAGFIQPTLALPVDPVPMLVQLREYFNANPDREVVALKITAVEAQLRITDIEQAQSVLAQARTEQITRKKLRDEALKKLRNRLSGLRAELAQLLSDEDGRWYDFGFHRPADGRVPAQVATLELIEAGPGIVLAKWEPVPLAEDYRVTWKPANSTEQSNEVGRFRATSCAITGLPKGISIVVAVSARNRSGESVPAEKFTTDASAGVSSNQEFLRTS